MAQVSRTVHLPAPPDIVWKLIGSLQALPRWHPAIRTSDREEIDGVEHWRLTLVGGGEILEKSWGGDERSYGYEILASPLPVANYRATITVAARPSGGSSVTWASSFEPTAANAREVIAAIYEAGLSALTERFI